ncbi:MAG: S46 family peptidase [Bacteroidales bacterium]|nr:S46 family peptidase [Bacteroidales bacterium]
MKKTLLLLTMTALFVSALADEGMWIPMLLGRNEADMQKAGMRITAKDIYDINNACLKDAILLFNQGCTGEYVSNEGLFLTNHHCGYSYITSHSTVEHDYLTNGFWAMSRGDELPCPGLTATRLVRMEDVTTQVLDGVNPDATENERNTIIERNISKITTNAVKGTHYKAIIKPFYYGNQYFMYINEVFTDVRLVGAPPSNIGKFGGDTDNWMWPRHTGDFSMFRVYADNDNKPANYSPNNKPYKPLKFLEISLDGIQEGDFTFVFGYPGTTQRYVTSDAVQLQANIENPIRINLRTIRLKHYNNAMNQSPAQRLKYASRVASIANGWKKWQGETLGINRLKGVEKKREFEQRYQTWADDKPQYYNVLSQLHEAYKKITPIEVDLVYFQEAVRASDFMSRAQSFLSLANLDDDVSIVATVNKLRDASSKYFKDFNQHTIVDRAIFIETYLYMWQAGYAPYLADNSVSKAAVEKKLADIYDKSILNNERKLMEFLDKYTAKSAKKLKSDPALKLYTDAYSRAYDAQKITTYRSAMADIQRLMRTYVKGMMEMQPDVNFFPDANLTLRVAYGHVEGFRPRDGVYYKPYSTLQGIMEKENPDIYDYVVEPKLKELYAFRDYGQYGTTTTISDTIITEIDGDLVIKYKNHTIKDMPVGFIATNHTTGGNSGSPVLNADGRLIGLNFDRCWEGTMSDLLFDPDYCRNICLDIRYCLFIIDKFAGAKHLVDEMTLVKSVTD